MESESWIKDKICVITGATNGIGKETARELNRKGAKIIILCRNMEKGKKTIEEITSDTGNSNIELIHCDLEDQNSIKNAVDEFKKKYDRLDVLINNAGNINFKKQLTADGFEKTWAVNHLGHFLLTNLLLDIIKSSSPSRIINLSSHGHNYAKKNLLDDMNYEKKKYKHITAYGNSKLMNIYFTNELAEKLEGTGVSVNSVHPGPIRTGFGKGDNPWYYRVVFSVAGPFLKSVAAGASTSIHVASANEIDNITGKYWAKSKIKNTSRLAKNKALQEQLWQISAELTNLNV